ncbi:hypothetical protein P167DRAFT_282750 [Morchella conica CCBAS932]|uniref:Protein kinase domain-containing protein n=1 Tax=Morchella conica CCBAS932 TaxID=1392247 RepID=A0A3N4KHP7_9PEZI|nr:hypothetical protein P167DRAFT_282750 [Morchella conica CCBAS932]
MNQKWKNVKVLDRGTYGMLRLVEGDDGSIRPVKEISVTTPNIIGCRELHALINLKQYPDHFVQFHGW